LEIMKQQQSLYSHFFKEFAHAKSNVKVL